MSSTAGQDYRDGSYGWVVVGLAFLSSLLVLGSRFSMGMFLPYMPQALGVSMMDISAVLAVSMIGAAVAQPLAGLILDRWGGSVVLSLGLACAGLALCGTAFASALWQVLLLMGCLNAVAYAAVSPVSTASIVASWFDKRRGAALGIATSGTKMAMVLLPPVIAALIALYGWRIAMACLGLLVLLLIPAVLLLLKPAPDSAAALRARVWAGDSGRHAPPSQFGTTVRKALRTRTFWCIAIALFANGLVMNLVFIHLPNYVLDAGYADALAATALSLLGAVGLFGTMATGVLSDRLGRRNMLLVMFGARAVTALMILVVPVPVTLVAFVVIFGLLGYGAIGVLGAMGPDLFGRQFAVIMSVAYVFNQLGGAAGVYVGGASLSLTGGYDAALLLSVALTLVSLVGIAMIRGGERRKT